MKADTEGVCPRSDDVPGLKSFAELAYTERD